MTLTVFLDRDGVLNEDRGYQYVRSWDDFEFIPGVKETLARLNEMGVSIVIFTNQSCIAKGIVSFEDVERIHQQMVNEIEQAGGRISAIQICPHRDEDQCDCRKPKPGLLQQAAKKLDIRLEETFVVGDSLRDIEAGHNAGAFTVLVQSGKGKKELAKAAERGIQPDAVLETLSELPDLLRSIQHNRADPRGSGMGKTRSTGEYE